MPARSHHPSEGAPETSSSPGDRLLVVLGLLLIGGPLLLGWPLGRPSAASLMTLGALLAGAAGTAMCGYPAAAAAGALVFGTGAIMILPPIGGFAGLPCNLALLTAATLIAARYFRRAEARSNE